jgi:hypothetical protein
MLFSLADPALAKMKGGGGGLRAPGFVHTPKFIFRAGTLHGIRHHAPGAYGTVKAFTPYGTVKPFAPYGTVKPFAPYGTVAASHAFGTAAPKHHPVKPKFARRHHAAYHTGWNFIVTYAGDAPSYIGVPYDPSEAIPVYGPAYGDTDLAPPSAQVSGTREENAPACRSEQVTVPGETGGDREIMIVRC